MPSSHRLFSLALAGVVGLALWGGCSVVNAPDDVLEATTTTDTDTGGNGGAGGSAGCVPSDCPGTDTTCSVRACDADDQCTFEYTEAGEPCTEGGGTVCDGEGACVECVEGSDCDDGVCTDNSCAAPACDDDVRNGNETDVDCGGTACSGCADGQDCIAPGDCTSGFCVDTTCSPTGFVKTVTITSSAAQALTDVQVPITISSTDITYTDLHPNADDLRFSTDGLQFDIPYWIEFWNSSGNSRVWVEVPNIPASGSVDIYMLYGNSSLSAASDGEQVFEFFDDFEDGVYTDKWDVYGPPAILTESGGELHLQGDSHWDYLQAKAIFSGAVTVHADLRLTGSSVGLVWSDATTHNRYTFREYNSNTGVTFDSDLGASNSFENTTYPGVPFTLNANHRVRASARLSGSQVESLSYCNESNCNTTAQTLNQTVFTTLAAGVSSHSAAYGDLYVSLFFVTDYVPDGTLTVTVN